MFIRDEATRRKTNRTITASGNRCLFKLTITTKKMRKITFTLGSSFWKKPFPDS
jgi:hypothetical protein